MDLQKKQQTTLELYMTSKKAFEKWKAAPEKVKILDVPTPEEYIYIGHAAMIWNEKRKPVFMTLSKLNQK